MKPAIIRGKGEVDAYQEYLNGLRTIGPNEAPSLYAGLVPDQQSIAHLPEMAAANGVWRGKGEGTMFDDPAQDANGGRRTARARAPAQDPDPGDQGTEE